MFLEDFSATLGVVIAAAGIGMTQLTGSVACALPANVLLPRIFFIVACCVVLSIVAFDSIASISVGLLLGTVAVRLVNLNKRFLLGQSVDNGRVGARVVGTRCVCLKIACPCAGWCCAETIKDMTSLILANPSIEYVGDVQSQWVGPASFSFKAEVDFDGTYLAASLQPR